MTGNTTRRLLVIASHPDDEVLGCGGLLARTKREGGEFAVLILTEGSTTQYPDRPDLVEKKEVEAANAVGRLGGGELEFARLPDMALSTLAPAEVSAPIERMISEFRPMWVLTHHGGDLNRDHQVAHEATRVACRPRDAESPRLLTYETVSSTEWGTQPFEPNVFVRVSEEDLTRKVDAFAAYETEMRPAPHPRSPETIRHLAALRGSQSGMPLAEAYRSVWERV